MIREASQIRGRILLQHAANDAVVPPEVSRRLFAALRSRGKTVEYREYPAVRSVAGHALFSTVQFTIWGPDFVHTVERALASCGH